MCVCVCVCVRERKRGTNERRLDSNPDQGKTLKIRIPVLRLKFDPFHGTYVKWLFSPRCARVKETVFFLKLKVD